MGLSSGKIDKYKYLTGEEILPSNQGQIIEQTKFADSCQEESFVKQRKKKYRNSWKASKTIEDVAKKQTKALQTLNINQQLNRWFSKYLLITETKDDLERN